MPEVEIRDSHEIPFFPEGVFDKDDREEDDQEARELAKYLRAMGEAPLWNRDKNEPAVSVFRLLWLPSFHHAIAVRIVQSAGSYTVYSVELDGKGGPKPGKIAVKKQVKLTEAEWTWLQVYLERSRFWKMPTTVKMDLQKGIILDGDDLICEGVVDGKYHMVDRVDPDPNFEKLCWYMLRLSGLDVKETWKEYHGEDLVTEIDR